MIDLVQFRDLIVIPALDVIGLNSASAVELLLGTAIQESDARYLKQIGGGPALGLFQMEPATYDDIWENYLMHRPDLAKRVSALTRYPSNPNELVGNLWFAAAMCRVHYRRVPEPLPDAGDVEGMAAYWKEHYNTHLGAGTEEEYVEGWYAAVGEDGVL